MCIRDRPVDAGRAGSPHARRGEALYRQEQHPAAVSYTHLDVYKRQALGRQIGAAHDAQAKALGVDLFAGGLGHAGDDVLHLSLIHI